MINRVVGQQIMNRSQVHVHYVYHLFFCFNLRGFKLINRHREDDLRTRENSSPAQGLP
jgi:hypothetical protein